MDCAIPDLSSAAWRKSTYSAADGGKCVETAPLPAHVGVRDSKNPGSPALLVSAASWRPFLVRVRTDMAPRSV